MNDLVVTCLLTAVPDPQRGVHLRADFAVLRTLHESVRRHGHTLVVIHDCLDEAPRDGVVYWRTPVPAINPYFRRWLAIAGFLDATDVDYVWCVDGTDVEMLHDPFPHMADGRLYVGSEDAPADGEWMLTEHASAAPGLAALAGQNLLNVGLVGGMADDVAAFARQLGRRWTGFDLTDMGHAQLILRDGWAPWITTGPTVHTVLHADDRTSDAWWRHK